MDNLKTSKDLKNKKIFEESRKKFLENPENLTLFNNSYLNLFFSEEIELTKLLLDIILEKDLDVESSQVQSLLPNLKMHESILDILAKDKEGNFYDIEIQSDITLEELKARSRKYISEIDHTYMLAKGQPYKEIKESYVIFILKKDPYHKNLPKYTIRRYIQELNEWFDDGTTIIFMNGTYKEPDAIGKLMEDMSQPDPKKMHYSALRKRAQELKRTRKGEKAMSSTYQHAWNTAKEIYLQEGREEGREEGKEENMYQLAMKVKSVHPDWTVNQIAEYLFLSNEELNKILTCYGTDERNKFSD